MCNNCKSKKEVLILEQIIDIRRLRQDLYDHFGTGAFAVSPAMILEADKIKRLSDEEIIIKAEEEGFDLSRYVI